MEKKKAEMDSYTPCNALAHKLSCSEPGQKKRTGVTLNEPANAGFYCSNSSARQSCSLSRSPCPAPPFFPSLSFLIVLVLSSLRVTFLTGIFFFAEFELRSTVTKLVDLALHHYHYIPLDQRMQQDTLKGN